VACYGTHLSNAMEKDNKIEEPSPVTVEDDLLVSVKSSEAVGRVLQDATSLMDWERGLVGWDSMEDPSNPL